MATQVIVLKDGDEEQLTCKCCDKMATHVYRRNWGETKDGLKLVLWNDCQSCGESWRWV